MRQTAVEKTQAAEQERLRVAELDARTKAHRVPSLLEQLASLQRELDAVGREKEEQATAHQEHTHKVRLRPTLTLQFLFLLYCPVQNSWIVNGCCGNIEVITKGLMLYLGSPPDGV